MEDGSDFDAYQRIHSKEPVRLKKGIINVVPKKYIYLERYTKTNHRKFVVILEYI